MFRATLVSSWMPLSPTYAGLAATDEMVARDGSDLQDDLAVCKNIFRTDEPPEALGLENQGAPGGRRKDIVAMLCTASNDFIRPDRLDGNGVLRGTCPDCEREFVVAEPVEPANPGGWWYLRPHEAVLPAEWQADVEAGLF